MEELQEMVLTKNPKKQKKKQQQKKKLKKKKKKIMTMHKALHLEMMLTDYVSRK